MSSVSKAEDAKTKLVVAPLSEPRRTRSQMVGATGWILASLIYSFRFHGASRVVVFGLSCAAGVAVVALLSLSRRRTRLILADGRLTVSGLLRHRAVFTTGERGEVIDAEVVWGGASRRRSRLWLLVSSGRHTALRLNRSLWDDRQLERLRERLDLPVVLVDTPQQPAELRRAYPGSIPWWAARPATATVAAIVIIVAALLGVQGLVS